MTVNCLTCQNSFLLEILGTDSGVAGYMGPNILDATIGDILSGEKNFMGTIGGAAGKIGFGIYDGMWSAAKIMVGPSDINTPQRLYSSMKLAKDTLVESFSSYSRASKMYWAYKTGMYYNNNGEIIASDINKMEALMIVIGADPHDVTDFYAKEGLTRAEETFKKDTTKALRKEWLKSLRGETDWDHFKAVKDSAIGMLDENDQAEIMGGVMRSMARKDLMRAGKHLKELGGDHILFKGEE